MDKNNNIILEIVIPTFNRPRQLEYLFESVILSLNNLSPAKKKNIGIRIHNNSTKYWPQYFLIYEKYETIFQLIGINNFEYLFTGLNIGSSNNCSSAILSSKGKYAWFLPDDDLAAHDSIVTILNVIEQYNPCMIHGGWCDKTVINYDENHIPINKENKIYKIIKKNKIEVFFEKNTLQAQEHVYNVRELNLIFKSGNLIELINEFNPALFSIVSLKSDAPFVLLEKSIGIFRDNDLSSNWRHRWTSLCLIGWPEFLLKCKQLNLISHEQFLIGKNIFISQFDNINHRIDILLGLRPKFEISPFKLIKMYKLTYLINIIKCPYYLMRKIILKFY